MRAGAFSAAGQSYSDRLKEVSDAKYEVKHGQALSWGTRGCKRISPLAFNPASSRDETGK